jgi:glutathione S-transferase
MQDLELVSHALCPYVQRAVIALAEKGVPFTRTTIDLAHKPDWFKELSPLGKVPLLRVDGHVLFESAAICDYLDETIEPRLHPGDPVERARHRAWIEFASVMLNDIWGLYTAPDEASFERKRADIAGRIAHLEKALRAFPFFQGGHFSLVDAAFGPVFRYFDVFEGFVSLGVFGSAPKVTAWRKAVGERASVRAAVGRDYPKLLISYVRAQRGYMATLALEAG